MSSALWRFIMRQSDDYQPAVGYWIFNKAFQGKWYSNISEFVLDNSFPDGYAFFSALQVVM